MKKRPIRIEGELAYITLTRGHEAVIDASDVPLVDGCNWCAGFDKGSVYARRTDWIGDKSSTVKLHRVIMGNPEGILVDHIDCNSLDNRRKNLRLATCAQNTQNQRISKSSTSGFKGVSWHKGKGAWTARIMLGRKHHYLGRHATADLAHAAYCEASARLHSDFGRTS